MNGGYIKLFRKSTESPLYFAEKFTRWGAWSDLLMMANYKDGLADVRGVMVQVKRGQVLAGEQYLADRWKWSRGRVRRFIAYLSSKTVHQIEHQTDNVCGIITILNYELYNGNGTATEQQTGQQTDQQEDNRRTTDGQQTDTLKKDKKDKKDKERQRVDWAGAQNRFNAIANDYGLTLVSTMTDARRKKFRARIKAFPDFFEIIECALAASEFLRGGNKRGWQLDFDYCVNSDGNMIKLKEGTFSDNPDLGAGSDDSEKAWKATKAEIAETIWRAMYPGFDQAPAAKREAVAQAMRAARDKYKDCPKLAGKDAVTAGIELAQNNQPAWANGETVAA